jgi:hypothetical protein
MNTNALVNVCRNYILVHNDQKRLFNEHSQLKKSGGEGMDKIKESLEQRVKDKRSLIQLIKKYLTLDYNHQAIIVDNFLFHYQHDTLFVIPLDEVYLEQRPL